MCLPLNWHAHFILYEIHKPFDGQILQQRLNGNYPSTYGRNKKPGKSLLSGSLSTAECVWYAKTIEPRGEYRLGGYRGLMSMNDQTNDNFLQHGESSKTPVSDRFECYCHCIRLVFHEYVNVRLRPSTLILVRRNKINGRIQFSTNTSSRVRLIKMNSTFHSDYWNSHLNIIIITFFNVILINNHTNMLQKHIAYYFCEN